MQETNLDTYGNPPIPWSRAEAQLAQREFHGGRGTYWLSTTSPDGRPHCAGVLGAWLDGRLYFVSGPGARKTRHLTANPACAVSASLPDLDLVLEGSASRVTDPPTLQRVASEFARLGWSAAVEGDRIMAPFGAPSAGPPPFHLYAMTPVVGFGVATAPPDGATRWRFQ
jgi:hypothetical protein